jgi:hypothetical protein
MPYFVHNPRRLKFRRVDYPSNRINVGFSAARRTAADALREALLNQGKKDEARNW